MRPGGLPCARVCLRNRRRERGTGRIRQAFPIGLRLVRTRRRLRNCTARVLLEAETLKDDVHMHVKILRRKDTGTVLLVYPSTLDEHRQALETLGRGARPAASRDGLAMGRTESGPPQGCYGGGRGRDVYAGRANVACDTGGICTAGGDLLTEVPRERTIPGPEDSNPAGLSELSVNDAAAAENAGTLDFVVRLDPASDDVVAVDYTTVNGSADAGDDYTATSGTLRFSAGETSKTVGVPIVDDAIEENDETLTLTLSNATEADLKDTTATGTIEDNDQAVEVVTTTPTVSVASGSGKEGDDDAERRVRPVFQIREASGAADPARARPRDDAVVAGRARGHECSNQYRAPASQQPVPEPVISATRCGPCCSGRRDHLTSARAVRRLYRAVARQNRRYAFSS